MAHYGPLLEWNTRNEHQKSLVGNLKVTCALLKTRHGENASFTWLTYEIPIKIWKVSSGFGLLPLEVHSHSSNSALVPYLNRARSTWRL